MKLICLFEEYDNHYLLPLTYFKHVAELKLGCFSIQRKWELLGFRTQLVGRSYLRHDRKVKCDSIYVTSHIIPTHELSQKIQALNKAEALFVEGKLVAAHQSLVECERKSGFTQLILSKNYRSINLDKTSVRKLNFPWDLIRYNSDEIINDSIYFKINPNKNCFIHSTAQFAKQIAITTTCGPVIIDSHAIIKPFTYLEGPVYIGKETLVKSHSSISNSSIHKNCRSAGEISASIQFDYSNKGHYGFIGQTILSSWTNLGAGTCTSNLKNNYSNVAVSYFGEIKQLDIQFLGLILGEHSKSAIGTLFDTASIIGAHNNIFGVGSIAKFLSSFQWGGKENSQDYELKKAYETAKSVMKRRNIEIDNNYYEIMKTIKNLQNLEQ